MERKVSTYIRKWLGVSRNFATNVGRKWPMSVILEALQERLAMTDIIEATAQGCAGLGSNTVERLANATGQRKGWLW